MESQICELIKTISYSSLEDWRYCPYYYKLRYLDKLKPFTNNLWTHFGKLVHRHLQNVLIEKEEPHESADRFLKIWNRFCRFYKKQIEEEFGKDFYAAGFGTPVSKAIRTIRDEIQNEFGNYKVLKIEENLFLPNENYPQKFAGYIDLVLELEDGRIIILDIKTCESSYMFNKFKAKYKDYQLTLYKHFFAIKHSIELDKIDTYFVTVERNHKSKKPLKLFKVSSGQKKLKNATEWLQNSLGGINKGLWIKNRMSCHKYGPDHKCFFYQTKHCK